MVIDCPAGLKNGPAGLETTAGTRNVIKATVKYEKISTTLNYY